MVFAWGGSIFSLRPGHIVLSTNDFVLPLAHLATVPFNRAAATRDSRNFSICAVRNGTSATSQESGL